MIKKTILAVLVAMVMTAASDLSAQTNVTPAQYLASQPKPNFAPGNHLPHLTRFAWPLSSNLNIELAKNWGYTLDLGDSTALLLSELSKTNSHYPFAKYVELATNYPSVFKLSINVNRVFAGRVGDDPNLLRLISDGFFVTNSSGLFTEVHAVGTNYVTNTWSGITNLTHNKVFSPEASDDEWRAVSEWQAYPIKVIQSNAPIAVILNGGEYGLGVSGWDWNSWKQDPRYNAAMATNGLIPNKYVSQRKAHQLGFLTDYIREAAPNREIYVFYSTGNEQSRYYFWWMTNWTGSWGWSSDYMNSQTDLPSFESYYKGGNSWTNPVGATWNQMYDLLSSHLNAVGYNLKLGKTLNYSWVSGGWGTNANSLSSIPRYMGFLKCLYTSGMNGGVAGYFDFPVGGFDAAFPTNNPPHWLLQFAALSHVHALFSHLENNLTDGDLLTGPQKHIWSTDQPAYEFTNTVADPNVRVLARKLRGIDQWLVTAWAAAGDDRNVSVTIPDLGKIEVLARAAGSVYQFGRTNNILLDVDPVFPSRSFISAPKNLRVMR